MVKGRRREGVLEPRASTVNLLCQWTSDEIDVQFGEEVRSRRPSFECGYRRPLVDHRRTSGIVQTHASTDEHPSRAEDEFQLRTERRRGNRVADGEAKAAATTEGSRRRTVVMAKRSAEDVVQSAKNIWGIQKS
ncbi:hypothetical protein NMG60_11032920 [Bertholletia excelsa]